MNKPIFATEYPIIQAPMAGGILEPDLIAEICNQGLLGFIPSGYLNLEKLEEHISTVKRLLNNIDVQFGVNIFIEQEREAVQSLDKPVYIQNIEKKLGLEASSECLVPKSIREEDYIALLIKCSVKIVGCTFGFFKPTSIKLLKKYGIKIIGSASSILEFEYCCEHGADAVVMQGTEAGGHQASFLSNKANVTSTLELIKMARLINTDITLIAAGGISPFNYREYLNSGADYVQLGTAFMMTKESNIPAICKEFMAASTVTMLTKDVTGKWARGIKNKLFEEIQGKCHSPFPYQHYLTSPLRQEAKKQLNPEYISLWGGSNKDNYSIRTLDALIEMLKAN